MKKNIFDNSKIIVLIMILSLLFVSCNDTNIGSESSVFFDFNLYLKVQNNLGENLLNEERPNYINTDSVYLYLLDNGIEILCNNTNEEVSYMSKGFYISSGNDVIVINLNAYFGKNSNYEFWNESNCTLLLKWNLQNTNTDTIFTIFKKLGNSVYNVYDKVYINGNLIVSSYEDNQEKMSQGIYPVIIK